MFVILCAGLLRLAFVINTERYPYVDDFAGDSRPYRERAAEIVAGDPVGREVFFDAPLYPYFLALTGGHAGGSDLAPKLAQVLLDTISLWLVYRMTLVLFGAGPALLASVMYGLYGFLLFYNGILLKPVLAIFLLLLSATLLLRAKWFTTGLTLGLGVLVRGNFLFLFPLFFWQCLRAAPPGGRRRGATLLLAGLALPLLTVTVRNGIVGRDFVPITYHAGPTFYHGNNPAARGTYSPILPGRQNPAYEKRDAIRIAEEKRGRTLKPSEINRFWFGEAFRYLSENPARFVSLTGRRAFLFWNGREIPDSYDFYLYRNLFPLLNVAAIPFGIIAPLALLGWFFPGRLRGDGVLPAGVVLSLFLSIVFLFVFGRYRLPAVPFLIPTAARFLYHAGGLLARSGPRPAALLPVALALLGLVLGNSWSPPEDRTTGLYNLGIRMEQLGRMAEAEALYREAVEESPRFAGGWNNLGGILLRGGGMEGAEEAFYKALSADPGHYLANRNVARLLRDRGDFEGAREHLEQAAATERSADVLEELATVAEMADKPHEAIGAYSEALLLDPKSGTAAINLGRLLLVRGELGRAEECLTRATSLMTHEPMAAAYLSLVRIEGGDLDGADEALDAWLDGGAPGAGRRLDAWLDGGAPGAGRRPDARLLLLKGRVARIRGEAEEAGRFLDEANRLGLPSGALLELLTGGENPDDWGLRK